MRVKNKNPIKTAHFTNFGARLQPAEADPTGFLTYREWYVELPKEEWTAAERWIDRQTKAINEWREQQE